MSRLSQFRDVLGFDRTTHVPFTKQYRIRCSQCEALVINGYPTHEQGCPSARHECRGCNELIPMNQKYCYDCGS
jgi:rRNA maturation endonuclease Nob1